jgi:hypothetical protein
MQARFLKFTINAGWESATTELPIFDARATLVVPVAHAIDRLTIFLLNALHRGASELASCSLSRPLL